MTAQEFLRAIAEREQADIPGPYTAEISPRDVVELRTSILATSRRVVPALPDDAILNTEPGYFGRFAGVPIWIELSVPQGEVRWKEPA